jgi:hypothetical protein
LQLSVEKTGLQKAQHSMALTARWLPFLDPFERKDKGALEAEKERDNKTRSFSEIF